MRAARQTEDSRESQVLFDSEFLRKLEFLSLISRRVHRGEARGEHATLKRGIGFEFSDYRSYQSGDDFRYIDWHVFSRINKLFVKLFRAEEDLTVHLLIDSSASMAFGRPTKIDFAKKIAAALGAIGILNLDRVGVSAFSDTLRELLPPHRSKRQLSSLLEYFNRIKAEGATGFSRSLLDYSVRTKRPGLAVVFSDLLDQEGYEKGLLALLYAKFDVVVIHIVAEEELRPPLGGAFRIVDSETGEDRKVTVDPALLKSYSKVLRRFFQQAESFCLGHGIEYLRANTVVPFEDVLLKYIRQGMHLK